ncbi:Spy/CpxP family protein refolding chaperone [Bradyrhizobium sp. AUGA SZCCT0177]|nr:Spy/CpxP family protein refolding chaperone [Bradyrhizobium sp. AUGA SZCCT0177]
MARPAPPPAMARPAPPPAMARPAAPAFRPAAPQQRPAMAPRPAPQIAAPPRPVAPRVAAPSRPSAPAVASPSRQDRIGQREQRIQPPQQAMQERQRDGLSPQNAQRRERIDRLQQRVQDLKSQQPEGQRAQRAQQRLLQTEQRQLQREERLQRLQQTAQERQRDTLTRESAQREQRIDRLQRRVQELQSRQPDGVRAQRAQQRLLQTEQRQLQHEQRLQQRDLARRQELGMPPSGRQAETAAAAVQAAARGRFAERFRSNPDPRVQAALEGGRHGWAPRHAWKRGLRAAFVPWAGHVFWPYAYSDIFEYTFWPSGYDVGYWAYAYDDFVDTVFWGADSPYSAYARLGSTDSRESDGAIGGSRPRESAGMSPQALKQLCKEPEKGITAWPIASIEEAVRPTPEQRAVLDDLKNAAAMAADAFKESCVDSFAMTPPGRLRAMMNRLSATLESVRIVRPALEKFYSSLSDEQQARFNALGPDISERSQPQPQQEANAQPDSCGEPKPSLTNLPIERIETVIRPAGKQKEALDRLREATEKAVQTLQAACPVDVPLTPVGRLEAMEKRLEAMMQSAKLVQPALDDFYATLASEQKARFNTLGRFAGR